MTAEAVPDVETIAPVEARATVGGIPVKVRRLRTREMFALARILANGAGAAFLSMDFDLDDRDALRGQLVAVLLLAVPNSPDEVIAFCRSVVEPVDDTRQGELRDAMANPDFGDLLDLLDAVLGQEADTIVDWVGKAVRLGTQANRLLQDRKPKQTDG